eukprot:gene24611-biopygen23908
MRFFRTEVIFETFWMILQAFWPPKLAKSGLQDAPQRRGYTRSLPMGPIDGRKMPFRMRSSPEYCRGYAPLSLTVGISETNSIVITSLTFVEPTLFHDRSRIPQTLVHVEHPVRNTTATARHLLRYGVRRLDFASSWENPMELLEDMETPWAQLLLYRAWEKLGSVYGKAFRRFPSSPVQLEPTSPRGKLGTVRRRRRRNRTNRKHWVEVPPQAPPKGKISQNVAPQAPPGLATGLQCAHSPHIRSGHQPSVAFDT